MNKRKLEEEIFQQNKFEKLNNIADSEDDDDDSVDENNYDVMQEQDIEGIIIIIHILNVYRSTFLYASRLTCKVHILVGPNNTFV